MTAQKSATKYSKILLAREKKGFTITDLSKRTGISCSTLINYERFRSSASDKNFKKLKLALRLSGDYDSYFPEDRMLKPRKRRYHKGDKCKYPGCKRKPAVHGYCSGHWANMWNKKKRQERDRLLKYALEKLAKADSGKH